MKSKIELDPFGESTIEDYDRLFDLFGIQPIKHILSRIPEPHKYFKINFAFGHRDLETILNAIEKKNPFAVMSGIKPSNVLHIGNKKIMDMIIYFQKLGASVFYSIADLEAYLDNGISFEESEKIAIDNIADFLALGLETKRAYIYRQSLEGNVKNLAYIFSRKITLNMIKAILGEKNLGLYFASLTQAGDILLPQLEAFEGPKPTIVPVGADQDPHLRLTRDIVAMFSDSFNFVKPSGLLLKLTSSLTGQKMSKRDPDSCLFLNETEKSVKRKISNAFTGGQPTTALQKKLGGNPEKCTIYEMFMYLPSVTYEDLLKLYQDCKSGCILCGEDKKRCIELLNNFLSKHREKKKEQLEKAEQLVKSIE